MEQQERLWDYERVHEAIKEATNGRRGHERIKEDKRGEQRRVGMRRK